MYRQLTVFFSILLSFLVITSQGHAAYILKNGKLVDAKEVATLPMEEHFDLGLDALKKKDWSEALRQFRIITVNFPDSSLAHECQYYLGVSYFYSGDVDLADTSLSEYLKDESNPKYFEETFQYKLAIADAYKNGARRHLFGSPKMPQLFTDVDRAIALYDEVANSLPNSDIAAKALMAKADLLRKREAYRQSIEAYQAVIKKFPRTDFAATSYSFISEVFLEEAQKEHQHPDLIDLAQINLRKFTQDFPRDEKIQIAQKHVQEMKEIYASALYETGCFYERKKEPKASILYYQNTLSQYPDTHAAELSQERLKELKKYADEIQITIAP